MFRYTISNNVDCTRDLPEPRYLRDERLRDLWAPSFMPEVERAGMVAARASMGAGGGGRGGGGGGCGGGGGGSGGDDDSCSGSDADSDAT